MHQVISRSPSPHLPHHPSPYLARPSPPSPAPLRPPAAAGGRRGLRARRPHSVAITLALICRTGLGYLSSLRSQVSGVTLNTSSDHNNDFLSVLLCIPTIRDQLIQLIDTYYDESSTIKACLAWGGGRLAGSRVQLPAGAAGAAGVVACPGRGATVRTRLACAGRH